MENQITHIVTAQGEQQTVSVAKPTLDWQAENAHAQNKALQMIIQSQSQLKNEVIFHIIYQV